MAQMIFPANIVSPPPKAAFVYHAPRGRGTIPNPLCPPRAGRESYERRASRNISIRKIPEIQHALAVEVEDTKGVRRKVTAVFKKHGLNFQYPENWEVQESYAPDKAIEIWLLAPSGAFWSVLAWPVHADPDELMSSVLGSLREQYDSFECQKVKGQREGLALTGYDSHFFCLDLLVTNQMRSVAIGEFQLLIMVQAESREFEQMERVFDAITTSLLRGFQTGYETV